MGRDKKRVKDFYNFLRKGLKEHEPNAAHIALAELEKRLGDDFLLVTQNVDNLHERAGSKRVLHMHGDLMRLTCEHNPKHEFMFSGDYWSANGVVNVNKDNGTVSDKNASTAMLRCVYDSWYWGDEQWNPRTEFVWGDRK